MSFCIKVAARDSALSRAQVQEVLTELSQYHNNVTFSCSYVKTKGDYDKKTSLRTLGKCNFFTKEIDEMLLSHAVRLAIHSAKDLPEPLASGLTIVALTRGLVSTDVLVLRENETLSSLKQGALIATSSVRREENVKMLRDDLCFLDVRGTIEERLEKLFSGEVSGVVVASAALIRLKKTTLNTIVLPGETPALQGRLAIVAREDDDEMKELFAAMTC